MKIKKDEMLRIMTKIMEIIHYIIMIIILVFFLCFIILYFETGFQINPSSFDSNIDMLTKKLYLLSILLFLPLVFVLLIRLLLKERISTLQVLIIMFELVGIILIISYGPFD